METTPAAAKLSLYLLILRDNSQSSTVGNWVRSGASGARGLQAWLAAIFLRVSGQQISLSRVFTMEEKAGLCALSFCQQSSINWWMASGQSIGAGNLELIVGFSTIY